MYMAAAAILVWGLSVIQGFIQNAAYAELATTFPKASGLPGFAQHVFRTENYKGRYDKGKLIGGFSAWSYWFAWNPVLAIFAILVGGYLHGLFPVLAETFTEYQLSLISGLVIFTGLFIVNWFGLKDGAILGYILAAVSLIPLVILTVAPFATGHVDLPISPATGGLLTGPGTCTTSSFSLASLRLRSGVPVAGKQQPSTPLNTRTLPRMSQKHCFPAASSASSRTYWCRLQ